MKLTKRSIDAIAADSARERWLADDDLPGFALRVSKTGTKTFVLQYRAGRGRNAPRRIVTLGRYGAITPEQARQLAKKTLGEVAHGKDPSRERSEARKAATLAELSELWLADVQRLHKPRTAREYGRLFRLHVVPLLGTRQAAHVTPSEVAKLSGRLADRAVTANRALSALSAFYSWAARRGHVAKGANPAKGLERYREQGRERFLSNDELARLGDMLRQAETEGLPYDVREDGPKAKHAPKPENRRVRIDPHAVAAIRLLLLTGCRLREILGLEWAHVDFDRAMLHLPDAKAGKRSVALGAPAIAILADLPRLGRYVVAGKSAGQKEERPRSDLNKPWARVRRAAGLDGVRLHDLRHSHASVGVAAGLGLPIVGKLLGHRVAATTSRYAHIGDDPLRRAAERVSSEIAARLGLAKGGEVVAMRREAK